MEEIIQQAFDRYGLVGMIIAFLLFGPGYTYLRTKNNRITVETTAQKLLNTFLIEEREHAEMLENTLRDTLNKLESARNEVFQLRMELAQTQHSLTTMPDLDKDVQALTDRMMSLEEQVERLRSQIETWQREKRVEALEAVFSGIKDVPQQEPPIYESN